MWAREHGCTASTDKRLFVVPTVQANHTGPCMERGADVQMFCFRLVSGPSAQRNVASQEQRGQGRACVPWPVKGRMSG